MEDYEKGKTDVTDKSTVEIPDGLEFPREVTRCFPVDDAAIPPTAGAFSCKAYRHHG